MSKYYQNFCWFCYLITVHKCIKVTKILIQFDHSSGLIQCAMQ